MTHMCPGASACPDCAPDEYAREMGGGDGLMPGEAARIAERIIADNTPSTVGGWGSAFDHSARPVAAHSRGPLQAGADRQSAAETKVP